MPSEHHAPAAALQSRLVREMRLNGIDDMAAGNACLPALMADCNTRFAREPRRSVGGEITPSRQSPCNTIRTPTLPRSGVSRRGAVATHARGHF